MASQEADDRARQLSKEEEKVRALNENGWVDYVIQEYALWHLFLSTKYVLRCH